MSAMKWTDITNYRQGGDRTPHWWELKKGFLSIRVGDDKMCYEKGQWHMTCHALGMEGPLTATTLEQAQHQAVEAVRIRLNLLLKSLETMR